MTPQLRLTSTGNPAHIAVVAQEEETIFGVSPWSCSGGFFPLSIFFKFHFGLRLVFWRCIRGPATQAAFYFASRVASAELSSGCEPCPKWK